MKTKIKNLIILLCLIFILILPYLVFAAGPDPLGKLDEIQEGSGYAGITNENNLSFNIGRIMQAIFAILGIIFVILMLLAGYHWMTAAGDQAKVTKAKETIYRAIIGLIIMVGSYAIAEYVLRKLTE